MLGHKLALLNTYRSPLFTTLQSSFVGGVVSCFSGVGIFPKNLAILGTVKTVAANRNGSVNLVITQAIANVPTANKCRCNRNYNNKSKNRNNEKEIYINKEKE